MYEIIANLAILTCSVLLAILFIILSSIDIKNNRKGFIQLILLLTLIVMKISYLFKKIDEVMLINKEYQILYMFLVGDIILLIIFNSLDKNNKFTKKDNKILFVNYLICVVSFCLFYNPISKYLNNFFMIANIILTICYFYKKYPKPIQVISLFYIINFLVIFHIKTIKFLALSNQSLDFLLSVIIFYKFYTIYIKYPSFKYSKVESNLNRSSINMKIYQEKLNNQRIESNLLKEDYEMKKRNIHILLGQFKKSALLIDENNYIVNSNDVVFENMFNKYKDNNEPIELEEFLNKNVVEKEKFMSSIEKARYYSEKVCIEINSKDGRIFECIFSLYEEYESFSVICILSDITYEKKTLLKIQENDIKYKKIVEDIPYSIILAKDRNILYDNNKLDKYLKNETIKNIILNEATKGEINYTINDNKNISLYVDRIKFTENNEECSLIEIKDISKYKKILSSLEESTNQYETLIDSIPEAICVLNYENKEFEYANNTFFNLFKIQDIEKMDFDEIYNDSAISSGNINESIKYIRKTLKDGYGGIINIESSVVLLDINKETKMVLIIRDITEEIKMESMQKEIEESESIIKDRDDFFINMSHELLTPANLLHTSNQFIERSCKDIIEREPKGEFANCISVMKRQVEILIAMINKIMELCKLEGNYYRNNKGIYDIVSLCEDIVTELNKYTAHKNINILFDTEEEEIYTEIDPDDMGKAILTVLSSVVKNSRINSTINFNIKTRGNKVIISMENFKRYKYEKNFEKYEEKILNLSMSIAKLIINMYKGKIDMKTNKEDCILIEIELDIEKNTNNNDKIIKTLDEDFIYNEYKNICDL